MDKTKGEIIDIDIDALFDDEAGTPPVDKNEMTERMTKRINQVKLKTETEVKNNIAKDLGYDSYEAMQNDKDKRKIIEAGYNPEDIEQIINPLVEKRIASDPRIAKLQEYEQRDKQHYINNQLKEIEKLTGLKVSEKDLPKETLDLWNKGVDLSKAYLATNPDKLKINVVKGTTTHLATGTGNGKVNRRSLSQSEKDLYRSINSDISEEELNKLTIEN